MWGPQNGRWATESEVTATEHALHGSFQAVQWGACVP